jgi:hypothetical protein
MATKTKKVDSGTPAHLRRQIFVGGTDFVEDDVIDAEGTLGRPARKIKIETGPGDNITVRLNAQRVIYPNNETLANTFDYKFFIPDFENAVTVTDTTLPTQFIGPSEDFEYEGDVRNIQVTGLTNTPAVYLE